MSKKIKDPIYGYIAIDSGLIPILDSPNFQRLRHVIQTNYTSLYPSSLHNRFSHSLGVYHLGILAFDSLTQNSSEFMKKIDEEKIKCIKNTFLLACLCHDLGHAPFSHTGEIFYPKDSISRELEKLISDTNYSNDLNGKVVGKEHEIMSALLALKVFPDFIKKDYYDFFARCIIGLPYNKKEGTNISEITLKCACIELLNSQIIDIDKLDYLLRDSYMSGYNSIELDYNRLIAGISIYEGNYPLSYKKGSLSVLESVLNAHDLERRWLQSHPAVLYESYLVKRILNDIGTKYDSRILSYDSLTEEGIEIENIGNIKLLSDSDIIFLAKQNYEGAAIEFFKRKVRKHPIWKSEAEYNALFNIDQENAIFDIFKYLEDRSLEYPYSYSINDKFLNYLKEQRKRLENDLKNIDKTNESSSYTTVANSIKNFDLIIDLVNYIKNYMLEHKLDFDFFVISHNKFKRNIHNAKFQELPIYFENISIMKKLSDISDFSFVKNETKKFFYFYYNRVEGNEIDAKDFARTLEMYSAKLKFEQLKTL